MDQQEQVADLREAEMERYGIDGLTHIERESRELSPNLLECLIDRATAKQTRRSALPPWKGSTWWLWTQWRGTIFESSMQRVLISMAAASLLVVLTRVSTDADRLWRLGTMPDPAHPVVARLKVISGMWDLQLTLTTFVSTFFISHAYSFWRKCYALVRTIQGRLSDLALLLCAHAARDESGRYTARAREMLDRVTRHLSLLHVLFWASIVRRAPGSDRFGCSLNLLLSRRCLLRMQERGYVTPAEGSALLSIGSNPRSWYLTVIAWVLTDTAAALRGGVLHGSAGLETSLLDATTSLRGACAQVPDELTARMPLAYVHFVQILVDLLCVMAPFALYPRGGACTIFLAGLVNLFFGGLQELSKTLLDPFGNRRVSNAGFSADVQVDVLVAQSNANLGLWPRRAESLAAARAAGATFGFALEEGGLGGSAAPGDDDEMPMPSSSTA